MYLARRASYEQPRAVEVGAIQVWQLRVWPAAQLAAHRRRQAAPLAALPCTSCVSVGGQTAAPTAGVRQMARKGSTALSANRAARGCSTAAPSCRAGQLINID
jgi:hypothetical protein